MFKKISMVTVLSMTFLLCGVLVTSVNAGSTYHNDTIETYSMGNALPFYHHNNCFSWMQNESHEQHMTQEQDKKESNKTDENQLEYQTDQAEQERQHPSKQQNQSEHQDQLSQFEQEVV